MPLISFPSALSSLILEYADPYRYSFIFGLSACTAKCLTVVKCYISIPEHMLIPSSCQYQEAQVQRQEGPPTRRLLFIHGFVVQIWSLQQENRKMGKVNVIRCLFRQVHLLALQLCPPQELVWLPRAHSLICQNGKKEGFWDEALLDMFTLASTGNEDA